MIFAVTRWSSGRKRCTRKTRIFEAEGRLRGKSVLKWRPFVRFILNLTFFLRSAVPGRRERGARPPSILFVGRGACPWGGRSAGHVAPAICRPALCTHLCHSSYILMYHPQVGSRPVATASWAHNQLLLSGKTDFRTACSICCRDIVLSLSANNILISNLFLADKDKTMSLQQIGLFRCMVGGKPLFGKTDVT